jgi:hypothetical protein
MHNLREKVAHQLLRISVTHAMDSLEIKQRHQSMPPHTARDRCDEMIMVADTISRISLRLAIKIAPLGLEHRVPPTGNLIAD